MNPNLNVILTACLTVYVGCYRSVKPTLPSVRIASQIALIGCYSQFYWCVRFYASADQHFQSLQETMSNEHAMRFPLVGSAMLLSLFLLFKFLSKDLVNAVLTCYFFVLGIIALWYVIAL